MNDKHVGELWLWYTAGNLPESIPNFSITTDWTKPLIRKLVQEEYLRRLSRYGAARQEMTDVRIVCLESALKRFGIPVESWKE